MRKRSFAILGYCFALYASIYESCINSKFYFIKQTTSEKKQNKRTLLNEKLKCVLYDRKKITAALRSKYFVEKTCHEYEKTCINLRSLL